MEQSNTVLMIPACPGKGAHHWQEEEVSANRGVMGHLLTCRNCGMIVQYTNPPKKPVALLARATNLLDEVAAMRGTATEGTYQLCRAVAAIVDYLQEQERGK